jgi:hypothetical protein
VGDRADAGLGRELILSGKAFAHVAELGQDLGGVDASGARERHDDPAVRQLGDGLFDARRQLGDREDEAFKDANQRADDLAPGLGFGVTGETGGSGAQAGQQICGRTTPAVSVLDQEAGEALLAETAGAVWVGIAADEGERDRAVDGSEDGGCAGPEAFEQAAKLIGKSDALGDEVVAPAH